MHVHAEYCNEIVARRMAREFEMIAYLGAQLQTEEHGDADVRASDRLTSVLDPECRQALLDSFFLHARVLREFFYKDRPKDGDVLASHFVEHWKILRPPEPTYLLEHRHQLDRRLGHLTLSRLRDARPDNGVDVRQVLRELNDLIGLFRSQLSEERRTWFDAPPPLLRQGSV